MTTTTTMLQMVGNTPLVELKNMDAGKCQLFVKLENQNPGGSIKDRVALSIIKEAEANGQLKPGDTIVEATAGNTGLGLAQVALLKGYKLVVVIPDKMSQEKIAHLKATGAEVIITRSDVSKGDPDYYQEIAARITKERNAFYANQFGNSANPKAHAETTAPEIWEQMQQQLDAVVCGVGTGGHLTGIGNYFKQTAPHVKIILADPEGSVLTEYVKTGKMTNKGSWKVEGIGGDYITSIVDMSLVNDAITVSDAESFATARTLLKNEGILAGSSSGTVIAAALRYCRAQTEPKRVVTFVYDTGNKYLSKMYNDTWMSANGFKL